MLFMGLDVGTQGVRCVVADEKGQVRAAQSVAFQALNAAEHPGWYEQRPGDWAAAMEQAVDQAPDAEGGIEAARYYREEIGRRMEEARQSIDRLESLTAAEYWPYPTYADILFSV